MICPKDKNTIFLFLLTLLTCCRSFRKSSHSEPSSFKCSHIGLYKNISLRPSESKSIIIEKSLEKGDTIVLGRESYPFKSQIQNDTLVLKHGKFYQLYNRRLNKLFDPDSAIIGKRTTLHYWKEIGGSSFNDSASWTLIEKVENKYKFLRRFYFQSEEDTVSLSPALYIIEESIHTPGVWRKIVFDKLISCDRTESYIKEQAERALREMYR